MHGRRLRATAPLRTAAVPTCTICTSAAQGLPRVVVTGGCVQVEAQGAKVLQQLTQQEQLQEAKLREQEQAVQRRAAEAEQRAVKEKLEQVCR